MVCVPVYMTPGFLRVKRAATFCVVACESVESKVPVTEHYEQRPEV